MPLTVRNQATLKRILLFAPALLYVFSPPIQADERPNPCANQEQARKDLLGKPGYDEAEKAWQQCATLAIQQRKTELEATRDTWAASLDKLPNGGWIFLMVSPDGTYAVFGSRRHATREGSVVSLWLRYEYREQQTLNGYSNVKSVVERDMYDCARVKSKGVSSTYYGENNLGGGTGSSVNSDEAKVSWAPAIPGTVGDYLLDWACKAVPRVPTAKP
jgi:hypothetical protein